MIMGPFPQALPLFPQSFHVFSTYGGNGIRSPLYIEGGFMHQWCVAKMGSILRAPPRGLDPLTGRGKEVLSWGV